MIAGEQTQRDVLFIAVVRVPPGEEPFMREAIEDAAPTMNATAEAQTSVVKVSEIETPLRMALLSLGFDTSRLGV